MTPEGSAVDREELASFLATAPEHLKGWAGEQLARLEGAEADGADGAEKTESAGPAEPAEPGAGRRPELPRGGRSDDGERATDDERAADVEDVLGEDDEEPAPRASRTGRARRRPASKLQQRTGVSRVNLVLVVLLAAAVVIIIRQTGLMGQQAGQDGSAMTMPSNHPAVGAGADPSAVASMDQAEPVDTGLEASLKAEAEADSTNISARQQLGVMYLKADLYQDAVTWLQQILDIDPDNLDALLAIGSAEYQSSQYDAAERHWRRVTELDPGVAEPWYNLGFLYMARTPPDSGRATECWNKVIEIAPDSDLAAGVRTHLSRIATASPTAAVTVTPTAGG
mgnify:FL=1